MLLYNVERQIRDYGYWYTYWYLTDDKVFTKRSALWLIWVTRQAMLHRDGKTIFTRIIDKLS